MKNPWPNRAPKRNMSLLIPPGFSSDDPERVVRGPNELSSDPVLQSWQKLESKLMKEEKIILQKLADLSDRTGMPIIQENGQRRYGPDESIPKPIRGSEVFIGKLPRDCYEPELIPVLEKVGKIYEVRLMMNFSGNNRGYCFVQYANPLEAERAVYELNNYEIRKGWRIGVARSVDNCRLFLGRIPKDKDAEAIKKELNKLVEGVEQVVIRQPFGGNNPLTVNEKNRGFAFVEFNCHKAAAMARRRLILGKLKLWGQDVAVDWAEPEPEGTDLIIRGLAARTNEDTIRAYFNAASHDGVVTVKKRYLDRANISFQTHYQALIAKASLENQFIDGRQIQIEFDKSSCRQNSHVQVKGSRVRVDFNNPSKLSGHHAQQYLDNIIKNGPPPSAVSINQKLQRNQVTRIESLEGSRKGTVVTTWNELQVTGGTEPYRPPLAAPFAVAPTSNGFYFMPTTTTYNYGSNSGFPAMNACYYNYKPASAPVPIPPTNDGYAGGVPYDYNQSPSAPWSPSNSSSGYSEQSMSPDCAPVSPVTPAAAVYNPFSNSFPVISPCY